MTVTVICTWDSDLIEKAGKIISDPDTLEFILGTRSDNLREQRLNSYSTLFLTLSTFFGIEDAKIIRDGKPRVAFSSGEEIYFNISHRIGISAVTVSDECEVGVDIEEEISSERCERIKDRYLSEFEFCNTGAHKRVYYLESSNSFVACHINSGNNNIERIMKVAEFLPGGKENEDVSSKWTALEAILKCDGRGFSALNDISTITSKTDLSRFVVFLKDKKYFLSVATKKQ